MNLEQLRELVRSQMRDLVQNRAGAQDALTAIRSDENSTADQITHATSARDAFDQQIDALIAREADLTADIDRDTAMQALQSRIAPTATGAAPSGPATGTRTVAVGDGVVQREPRTYTAATNRNEHVSFFQDAYRSEVRSDRGARERLERHAKEVEIEQREQFERATGTGAYAGLVVPQYLTDLVAPVLRAGRPLANLCNGHQLPNRGMQLIIPRGTTGATTAVQATENSAVSNTDEVLANLTVPVVTIAGQQDVSRQALERGEMIDSFVYGDLARAYAANLDNQIINGSGAAGQHLGVLNTAGITAASAYGAVITAALFTTKVAGQITAVNSVGAGLFAKAIVLHPRRWGWLMSISDTTGRPIVTANTLGNFNALANITNQGDSADGEHGAINTVQYVGVMNNGLPVISDLNVPITVGTNSEDIGLASDLVEYHLWEEGDGAPTELRFDQTTGGSLTTKLVVYGYSAFTAGRYPGATGKFGGVDSTATFGQVAPAF